MSAATATCPICRAEVGYIDAHFRSSHPAFRPVVAVDPHTRRVRIWYEIKAN